MSLDKTPQQIKLDERNYVEKPLLDQLNGLGWEIIDLDSKQHPADTFRESFTEVVMLPVLREQLKVINPWLEDDQVEEMVKQLTASFPSTGLLENNKYLFERLLEGTSPRERSGIIWHTQGSGKSLTMMFMVREMYRHAKLSNWKVVFVTDRTQLEDQLSETSQSIGFTVKVADSIRRLVE